jgi:hypothetical protein
LRGVKGSFETFDGWWWWTRVFTRGNTFGRLGLVEGMERNGCTRSGLTAAAHFF